MAQQTPLTAYRGPVTDNGVWARFVLRDDDVIVNTPPKCGTTWMLTIVMMLIHGRVVPDAGSSKNAPWLDCGLRDAAGMVAFLDGLQRRRCIKSHTPFDGVPFLPEPTYIGVYRHPVDVHFSMRDHVANMKVDLLGAMFGGDTRSNFQRFLTHPCTSAGTDDLTLASIVHHYREARARASGGNLHFFHYADLTRDLSGQIRRLAGLLDIAVPQDVLRDIAEATQFGAMRRAVELSERRFSEDGIFRDAAAFFASGSSNKWEGELEADQMAQYAARLAELLPDPAERAWLEWGHGQDDGAQAGEPHN